MFKFLNRGHPSITIGIIAVLVIVVGGGILAYQYYYIPKGEVKDITIETPKTARNETVDWKMYTNKYTEFEFEIKYPQDFSVVSSIFCQQDKKNGEKITDSYAFYISNSSMSIKFCSFNEKYTEIVSTSGKLDSVIIDGHDALVLMDEHDSGDSTRGKRIRYYIKKDANSTVVVDISFGYPFHDKEKIADQILSTFRFLPKQKSIIASDLCSYAVLDNDSVVQMTYDEIKDQIGEYFEKMDSIAGLEGLECPLEINNIGYNIIFTREGIKIFDVNEIFLQEIRMGDRMSLAVYGLLNFAQPIISANFDVNFDGYKDLNIAAGYGYGGVNFFTSFYLFNPQDRKFKEVPELQNMCNPNIQHDKKQIVCGCKSGPTYCESTYQFDGENYQEIKSPQNDPDFCN